MKTIRTYYPIFILIICCYLYSINYMDRLIYVLGDESTYSNGAYRYSPDWGPIYTLYYYFLNSITRDQFLSIYVNYFIQSFILVPALTYITVRNLGLKIASASFIALIAMLSSWNYPSDTRVQIFSYFLLLIAFNIRWKFVKTFSLKFIDISPGRILFYSLLAMSIYIRQDNIIIVITAFIWDAFHDNKKLNLLPSLIACFGIYIFFLKFFGSTYTNGRSVEIFLDHFAWNNTELFTEYFDAHVPARTVMKMYFKNPQSLWEIFMAHPGDFIIHILKNVRNMIEKLPVLFSLEIDSQWKSATFIRFFFVISSLYLFSGGLSNSPLRQTNIKELKLFSLAFLIKCIGVSILLNWHTKYFFELQIILLVWIVMALAFVKNNPDVIKVKFIELLKYVFSFRLKPVHIWYLIPFLFFFYIYENKNSYHEKGLHNLVTILKEENARYPIKNLLAYNEIYLRPKADYRIHEVVFTTSVHPFIKTNLKKYLDDNKIDTIVLHNVFRKNLTHSGLEDAFADFELNYDKYGYQVRYANKYRQIIYRKIILENKISVK